MINLYDLLEAANGQLFGEPAAHLFSAFCVDSRLATPSCLYVALRDRRGDGHHYIAEAVERGAVGVLCSRPPDLDTTGLSVILVKNPMQALMAWSHLIVGKLGVQVVGVAGTAGKSIVLAAVEAILSTQYRVLASNSEYGGRLDIPMTLSRLTSDHQIVALALDVQQPGEMGEIVGAVRPHVGIVTHIDRSGYGRFDSPAQLADEFGLLVDYLSPGGRAILNYDDDLVRALAERARAPVTTYSTEADFGADLTALNISVDAARTGFDLRFNDQRAVGRWTPLLGKLQISSVLAAVAVGDYFRVPLDDALRSVTALEPLPGRMRLLEGINGSLLIDDSYKADLSTTLAALDWLEHVRPPGGRTIFVFGDLDAKGPNDTRSHRQAGQRAAEFVDLFVTEGAEAAAAGRAALDHGMSAAQIRTTYSIHDAVSSVRGADLTPNDLVLIKGGASSRMDLVVRALLKNPDDALLLARSQAEDQAASARPNRLTWIDIDREALAGNVRAVKARIGENVALIAVVKADAYGHGAVTSAQTALQNGAEMVAVSNIGEAMQLRDAGITAPILMMNYLPPDAARQAIQQRITATVYDLDLARAYDAAGRETGGSLRVHVKIDTGMGRLGVAADKSVLLFRHLARLTNLDVEGVYTHFATADEDADYLAEQNRRFRDVIAPLKASGFPLRYIHAANSAAALRAPETHYNAVRVGLALYGLTPSDEVPLSASFRPVMSWKALVAQVKTLPPNSPVGYGVTYRTSGEERIAILAVGFADGFRRAPHHAGEVLIHGEYAPVVGRVSMEKTAVNVSHIPDVAAGDEAVLLGRQGQREITAEDIAARLGTSNYEVVTTALPRQPRR
jgi:alanine racemase